MIIDAYCHIGPRRFLKEYVKTQLPQLLRFLDATEDSDHKHVVDDDLRIKYMDKFHIDMEVLSLAFRPIWNTIPEKDLYRLVRIANDSLAEIVHKNQKRFIGLCTLPTLDGEAIDELERSVNDLGMKGCQIPSNIRGKPLDSHEFFPFYEKMARYDLPVYIHPTNWKYYDWIGDYQLNQVFGWPFDTTLAMARLVYSGIFERLPNLKVVSHHTGAMVPFFSDRIRGFYEAALESESKSPGSASYAEKLKMNPVEGFKLFYTDTIVNGNVSALKCGYDFFGSDHLMFATDYPHGPQKGETWTREIIESVQRFDIPKEEKEKIFEKNVMKLLKIR